MKRGGIRLIKPARIGKECFRQAYEKYGDGLIKHLSPQDVIQGEAEVL